MKTSTFLVNLIVILFFNSITLNIASQPYKSIFGSSSTQWNELTYGLSSWTCILNPIKDTVIDLKTFKKICYSGDCPTVDYAVFIREDSTTGKVWGYEFYHNQERLIMDLSLNVGDTFKIYPNNLIYYDTIAIVDSVYTENGLKKIRLNLNSGFNYDEKLTFIEGIGTNFGIDYQVNFYALGGGWGQSDIYLLCSYKDGFLTYKNTFLDTCYLVWINIDEKANQQNIKVYPNPVKDVLNIEANNFSNKNIIIYNSLGQIVLSADFTNNLRLNLNSFKKGIYLVKIFTNHNCITKKVIKY